MTTTQYTIQLDDESLNPFRQVIQNRHDYIQVHLLEKRCNK